MKQLLRVTMVWTVVFGALAAAPDEKDAAKKTPQPQPPSTADRITLKDGKSLAGTVLDITDKKVVIDAGGEKKSFPRGQVTTIARAAADKLLALCQRRVESLKTEGKIEDWKGLADFCAKEKLLPERRRALREIVRLDPSNAPARTELGHAQLDDKWLDEDEVAARVKEGFQVVSGKLVKGTGVTARTEVRKEETNSRYKLLARTKLSTDARKKMDRERESRLKAADKFLAMKKEEYNGTDWTKRQIIKTQNFEINCNSTREVAKAYGALMELIRARLSEMFSSRNQRGNMRSHVDIYASQEEFMGSDQLGRRMGRGLGGYYLPSTQAITTFHGTFGFTGTTFSVLCHEGTHYYEGLVLKDFDNIPIWLIEGLAVYFGDGSTFDPKAAKITIGQIPRDRLAHIQEKMLAKRHTPVAKLITMTQPFAGSYYADAWALIYYLVKSGDKGNNLLKEYWSIGLDRRLTKEHFLGLAKKYFGGVEAIEQQYVDYILKLDMPSAGRVVGDYFVSDTFQFDFKAPGDDWQFFEDKDDKKMLVGLILPNTSAEVRVYYENNDTWSDAKTYFEAYKRVASAKNKNFKHDEQKDVLKSGTLEWYRVRYTREGDGEVNVSGELGGLGGLRMNPPGPGKEGEKDKDKKKKEPQDVTDYLLIQIDGVVRISCSSKPGDAGQFDDVFSKINENFTLCFARRW